MIRNNLFGDKLQMGPHECGVLSHSTEPYLLCPISPNRDPLVSIHLDGYSMLRKLAKLTTR